MSHLIFGFPNTEPLKLARSWSKQSHRIPIRILYLDSDVREYVLGQSQWGFHREFYDIKYHQFYWHGKEREWWSFMGCEEGFITMKLIWHGYLVLSLGICVHETPTKTGLSCANSKVAPRHPCLVTPGFKNKTECITICMPGSSFIHIT